MDEEPLHNERVYWVDVLCAMAVVKLTSLGFRNRTEKAHDIRYLSSTRVGLALFRLIVPIFRAIGVRLQATRQEYDFHDFRNSSCGHSAWDIDHEIDAIQERISKRVVARVDVPALVAGHLRRPYAANKMLQFLRIAAAYEIYDTVLNLSLFHRLARSERQRGGRTDVFVLARSRFNDAIMEEHYSGRRNQVETYADLKTLLPFARAAGGLTRDLVGALLRVPRLSSVRGERTGDTDAGPGSRREVQRRIAVGYTQGTDLETRNDVFWYPDSGLFPEQVLVYFGRRRFPASESAINQTDALGLDWMILSEWRPGRHDTAYLKDLLGTIVSVLRLGASTVIGRSWSSWWLWRLVVDLERRVSYWTAFFKEHHVAAHIHHVANTPNSIPLVFAAENAGAIDFGYQWSAGEFTLSVRGRIVASHVFFCWGSLFADQMRANGMIPDVVLLGGQVFGHLAGRRTDDSGRVRRELQRNGSDHIICVFDSGFKRDIYQTPKMIEEFYETVVTWGLHEPGIGLVIKPKEPLGKGLAATRSLLEQAIATGRCIVVDPAKSTVEAAQAADIVVGIGINTAVIEAALAGVPAVHFDLPGMVTAYPGMEHGMGRFVFRDGAELHAAIKGHMERGGNTTLGDHGDWLEKVDPFQNGKAAQSMGNYLRWYLESIDAGRDSQQAVADATARYSREIGPQYVVSGVDRPADTPRMGRND